MPHTVNAFAAWWASATRAERQELSQLTGISYASLKQTQGAYRTDGVLQMSPRNAIKIDRASGKLCRKGLAKLPRELLSPVCGGCEYAKGKCK